MSVSMIADIVTIVTFVSGVGLATKVSVSRRSEEWIRSLIINCLDDYFGDDSNTGKPADGNGIWVRLQTPGNQQIGAGKM